MESEDGQLFVKVRNTAAFKQPKSLTDSGQNLAHFVRTHEKALANALQSRRQAPRNGRTLPAEEAASPIQVTTHPSSATKSSAQSTLASVLTLGAFNSSSHNSRATRLSLTAHHLYYLLSKIEELGIQVGPMGVRLENIHADASPANYVSFLNQSHRSRMRSDRDSIHSVSSMRSVMSGMSSLWHGFGFRSSNNAAKTEKAQLQFETDLTYLYSAFTKIPTLRLSPDRNAHLIKDYEEFPFDTAVPLWAFKNLTSLEILDMDFRHFYGWDKMSEQLRSLTVKRAHLNDPAELLINIVLDDVDKRRRRSSKLQVSAPHHAPTSPSVRFSELARGPSTPTSPTADDKLSHSISPKSKLQFPTETERTHQLQRPRTKSSSPTRSRSHSRPEGSSKHLRATTPKIKRSGSGSSNSSTHSSGLTRSGSSSNMLNMSLLPVSKWRFLRHLSLADNSLTSLSASSLAPVANTLQSLDLSSNLFTEIPDSMATLTCITHLSFSNCMIESLHSLSRNPLSSTTTLSLRSNRLTSLAGIEHLGELERLDIRDNQLRDPSELMRLTACPKFNAVWISRNPFLKTYSNYRITIFNIFRDAPGFTEDIVIDSIGPGYNERRQLKDRPQESERNSKRSAVEKKDEDPDKSAVFEGREGTSEERSFDPTSTLHHVEEPPQDAVMVGSNRQKKGPKRRVVDLAQQDHPISSPPREASTARSKTPEIIKPSTTIPAEPGPTLMEPFQRDGGLIHTMRKHDSRQASSTSPRASSEISKRGRILVNELQHSDINGDLYRQKMEALKHEVGSNWLSLVGEQNWHDQRWMDKSMPRFPHPPFEHHNTLPLGTPSQGIVGGSRTLG